MNDIDIVERATEPMAAIRLTSNAEHCGIRDCDLPATGFVCEMCRLLLCEKHKRVRRVNGEYFVTCPSDTIGGS